MTTIYTGECPKCGHEQTREWKGEPWRGSDGEDSFAADCHRCGPGTELEMFPEEPEGEDETVEVFSLNPAWNGTTMVVGRSRKTDDDLLRRVRLLVVGAEDEADFEATYGTDPDEVEVYTAAAREIIDLVRATDGRAAS